MVKKRRFGLIAAALGVVLVFGLILYSQSGIFAKTPEVTAVPVNGYDQTLTVITDEDYSPYSFYGSNGSFSGHDVELIIMIANELNMNLDLRLMNWYEGIDAMNAGEADVLMTCDYSDTFAGVDQLVKCEPVSVDDFIVYSKARIASSDELYGKRIAIMRNGNVSAQIDMMNLGQYCIRYEDNRKAMQALISGEVDCAIMRQTVGTVLLQELNARGIEGYLSIGQSFMCFGVRNEEIAGKINGTIEKLKMTGTLDGLHKKWLTTFIRPYTVREVLENNSWLVAVCAGLVVLLTAAKLVSYKNAKKKEQERQKQLQSAYNTANVEAQRFKMITNIIDAAKWNYEVSADDRVLSVQYGDVINRKVDADSRDNPMRWVDIVHPEDRERALTNFMAAINDHSGATKYDEIFRIAGRKGNYLWNRSVGEVLRRDDGTGEFFGMSMDMTSQIEEQKKRLLGAMPLSNDVLTKANIGLWAFELDEGKPPRMYLDETMLGLVGLEHQVPPEEAYHAWYDYIDAGSYDLVTDAVAKMSAGEHAEVQYPWHYKDGRTIIVRCGGVRNFEYTKGIRIEGTHQDVTQTLHFDEEERRREEQQRQAELARIRAEASDKAKTEFLFNMSHDIRTPMNAILGYTDIGLRHVDDVERSTDSFRKIKTAGGHLLNLINDILEMSRIEYGKLELDEEPLDMRAAAEVVKNMAAALAVPKSIDFDMVIGDLKNQYVYADELHGNEVFINLISNAVKYTPEGGKVRYRIDQLSDAADGRAVYRFEVTDNGIGMSEEFQAHLFEAFSRERTSTVSRQEGAGLGLSIVKRIIDMAGGTISVRSTQGKGSVFTVELPLRVMDEAAIEKFREAVREKEKITGITSLEGKRVLLVEDNRMNREIAEEILSETGLDIDMAEDGELAVKAVIEKGVEYYDFILMDIQMPVMNGYEATKAIRKLRGGDRIPIIAVSANAFEEDKKKSVEAGMNDHVAKPINVSELFSVLAKFL